MYLLRVFYILCMNVKCIEERCINYIIIRLDTIFFIFIFFYTKYFPFSSYRRREKTIKYCKRKTSKCRIYDEECTFPVFVEGVRCIWGRGREVGSNRGEERGRGLSPWCLRTALGRRDRRRARRRGEGGRIGEEHSTREERVKSARRGRQTTGIASPDWWYRRRCRCRRGRARRFQGDRLSAAHGVHVNVLYILWSSCTVCCSPVHPPSEFKKVGAPVTAGGAGAGGGDASRRTVRII